MKRPALLPLAALLSAVSFCHTVSAAAVFPVHAPAFTQSLDGQWSFKYIPTLQAGPDEDFYSLRFDASAWKGIAVPANWELQGFAEPRYELELQDGLGLYRRTFRIPAGWQGRKVFLRFEGVAFGFDLWINGRNAGASSASAFNPHTFDVTDLLDANGTNLVAVRVSTKPKGWEFDVNDDWSLSGIFRDVTLFSVPSIHIQDLSTHTRLGDDGSADLAVTTTLSEAAQMRGQLLAPDGSVAATFDLPEEAGGVRSATLHVANPKLWTAEAPALYRLQLTVSKDGRELQSIEQRIGLREVRIADGMLQLNGRSIKLRGVNHHDLSPDTGRAISEAQMRQDLLLMKKANVNYVRTSHYAPDERFIALCDELGIYVVDEVAIGRGETHQDKPDYRDIILARVEPTIIRDKNHPSVIIWSIGNENPITENELEAARLAKQLDPTRPITIPMVGSYFARNWQRLPDYVDIYAPHYPTNTTLHEYADKLKRPVLFTEYAHALGLAADRIQEQWDIMQLASGFAGGSIWHFEDQGLLRTSSQPVDPGAPARAVWLDPRHYYDTHGLDGMDGIVYADRTPQADYWEVRKVYSPVQIDERTASVKLGENQVALTVENRYDFRTLAGVHLAWSLRRNGVAMSTGKVALGAVAHARETVRIPVTIPASASGDVLTLDLHCIDDLGNEIIDRTVQIDLEDATRATWLGTLRDRLAATASEDAREVRIATGHWSLAVARASGQLTIRDRTGRILVEGIYPHSGRKPTVAEALAAKTTGLWTMSTLTRLAAPSVKLDRSAGALRLSVSGRYPRPDAPDEAFVGGYQLEVTPQGALNVTYDYTPVNATGSLSEAGLSIVAPAGLTELRWIGQGPHAGYPGKDRLNEFGLFHLNRDDLRFQGNRRGTELALLTTASGAGLALAMPAGDVAVERSGEQVVLSQNALIAGLGNKGTPPEHRLELGSGLHIAGKFTLLPLGDAWPNTLVRWFGKPAAAGDVFRPFYQSYDQ